MKKPRKTKPVRMSVNLSSDVVAVLKQPATKPSNQEPDQEPERSE